MFNNSLIDKEARLKMAEREREAESYRVQNQLGYSDRGSIRWVFGVTMLIGLLILLLILL